MNLPPAHYMIELTRVFRDLFWVFEQRCAASVSIRTCSVSAPEVHESMKHITISSLINSSVNSLLFSHRLAHYDEILIIHDELLSITEYIYC